MENTLFELLENKGYLTIVDQIRQTKGINLQILNLIDYKTLSTKYLNSLLENTPDVQSLHISCDFFEDEDIAKIADLLKINNSLNHFGSVARNDMSDKAGIIFDAMKFNSKITLFGFNWFNLSKNDMQIFANVLKENNSIKTLSLIEIKDEWVSDFTDGLKHNKSINNFFIGSSPGSYTENVRLHLIDALKHNKYITRTSHGSILDDQTTQELIVRNLNYADMINKSMFKVLKYIYSGEDYLDDKIALNAQDLIRVLEEDTQYIKNWLYREPESIHLIIKDKDNDNPIAKFYIPPKSIDIVFDKLSDFKAKHYLYLKAVCKGSPSPQIGKSIEEIMEMLEIQGAQEKDNESLGDFVLFPFLAPEVQYNILGFAELDISIEIDHHG
jgi:hypothetical protein